MKYVLDTTAFSAIMRRDKYLLTFLKEYRPGDIATVPPVVAEIHYGIKRLDNFSKKYLLLQSERDRLLSIIKVLSWLPGSSEYFGSIKADLESREKIIDDFDIAIAAIAISHKYGVITDNMDHFRRINGLESKNWK